MTRLSSRWTPHHVVRRDTSTGYYEEINPPRLSTDALRLQTALLSRPREVRFLGIRFRIQS